MAELVMTEESGTPSTPATNKWKLYPKADGFYYLDDAGVAIPIVIAPTSFTPTIANLTLGTGGTRTGRYTQVGKLVHFDVQIVLGTSPSIAGSLALTLPVTIATYSTATTIGFVRIRDASPATTLMGAINSSGTITVSGAIGSYLGAIAISSTVPFTWAASDEIQISGSYIAA